VWQQFDGGVLGLAWVGTLCQPPGWGATPSINTGITTVNNFGSESPTLQTVIRGLNDMPTSK
jgi:hypothetical protein